MPPESLNAASGTVFRSEAPTTLDSTAAARLTLRTIFSTPLPAQKDSFATRFWIRAFLLMMGHRLVEVRGLQNIRPAQDPFILAANHSQRLEALLLPALLSLYRGGKMVHFFTDWLVLLYPLIGRIVLLNQPIIVSHKPAKLRWTRGWKERYRDTVTPMERAQLWLKQGEPVGIFPEGVMNRDRKRLLRGQTGAAQLSLTAGVPVVPVGIRFPAANESKPISDLDRMVVEFGAPLIPSIKGSAEVPEVHEIRDWHAQIMQAISRLSGKQWNPENQRTRYVS